MIEAQPLKREEKVLRFKVYIGVLVLLIFLFIIGSFAADKIKQRSDINKKILGMESAVNGTPIMATREAIKESLAAGKQEVIKDMVLYGNTGDGYVCSVETDKGIITLKKKGDLMREEMVREKVYNTSVIFLGDSLYIFHPIYNMWGRFDYNPDMRLSDSLYLYSAYSYNELTAINATSYRCIQMDLPADEFSLGDYQVFDAQGYLDNRSLSRMKFPTS